MKTILICLLLMFTPLIFSFDMSDASNLSLSLLNEMDSDFWSDEMHIKCIEYKPYHRKNTNDYFVVVKFEVINVMDKHNLESFKIRVLNYSTYVSCIVEEPSPVSIDTCAYDSDYLCFYFKDSFKLLPSESITFTIIGVINDSDFDTVHSRLCFHAMQRWWLRATPICFDIKFRKEKILPKGVTFGNETEDCENWGM